MTAMTAWIAQIDAFDPVAGAAAMLRLSDREDERVCHLANGPWWPAIDTLPTLAYDFFDGGFGGQIATPRGSMRIATGDFPTIGRLSFGDARFRLWRGDPGQAFGAWTPTFDGRILAQPQLADGFATFEISVDDRWLDKPLLKTFAGTGGIEGAADLAGSAKQLALGTPRFVPATPIDLVDNVYFLHDGAIEDVEMAFDRAVRFGGPAGDHASLAALKAASIANGAYATCKALGLVRFGAPPAQPISFHLKGDKPTSAARARLPGAIIGRIAAIAGAASVSTGALAALDTARPYPQSIVIGEQTTAREVIQSIASSVNAVAGIGWLGQLWARPIGIGTPTTTLDASGVALPPVASVSQLAVAAPWAKLALEAERSWLVHALSDIAFTAPLVPRGAFSLTTTYREGEYVTLEDGSQWLFIATTPAQGVVPGPGTSATWAPFGEAVSVAWGAIDDDGGKPDDNATRNDEAANLIRSPMLLELAEVAAGAFVETVASPADGANRSSRRIKFPGSAGRVFPDKDLIAVRPGEVLFLTFAGQFEASSTGTLTTKMSVYNSAGSLVDNVDNAFGISLTADGATGWRNAPVGNRTMPAGAAFIRPFIEATGGSSGSARDAYTADFYLARQQPGADVTAANTQRVSGDSTLQIAANSLNQTTTELPLSLRYRALRGSIDESLLSIFEVLSKPGGVTLAFDATDRGRLDVTQADGAGEVRFRVTRGNGYQSIETLTIVRNQAAPSTGGGTTPPGSGGASVTSQEWSNPGGATHVIVAGPLTVKSTGSGTLRFSGSSAFGTSSSSESNCAIKAGYRLAGSGGAYTDAHAEVASSAYAIRQIGGPDSESNIESGYVSFAEFTRSGLTSSTDYEVVLYGRRANASRSANFFESNFTVRQ